MNIGTVERLLNCFFGITTGVFFSFFSFGASKKIPLQQGAKVFCGNNAQKSSDFEGKKTLELPHLDNGFQALTGCQNMRRFLKVLHIPLWPVAKFG
jgi:hypothetical protein